MSQNESFALSSVASDKYVVKAMRKITITKNQFWGWSHCCENPDSVLIRPLKLVCRRIVEVIETIS